MIEYISLQTKDDEYKKYNQFRISENLSELLFKDYYNYNTKDYNKSELVENLYKQNFIDKYDRSTQAAVYEMYIDNKKFKEKVLFIYSMIDSIKYKEFVEKNSTISNPNDYKIEYYVVDSDGVSVKTFDITLTDISFVF